MIHRLDQPVEGVILFAKNPFAAAEFSKQLNNGIMNKCYYAVAKGIPQKEADTLVDYLVRDIGNVVSRSSVSKSNTSRIAKSPKEKDAKEAKLQYRLVRTVHLVMSKEEMSTLEGGDKYSLFDIYLLTGRHHQIRVQMAHADLPLLGDKKYGDEASAKLSDKLKVRNVALCAYKLEFIHPKTKQKMEFKIAPKGEIFKQFLPDLS